MEKEVSDELIDRRKEKLLNSLRSGSWVYIIVLIVLIILAISIRTSNIAGLKDITTNNYTLGPDLDPFLFLRWAKYTVEHGSLPSVDEMRYVPLGYTMRPDAKFLPYSIAYFYYVWHFFNKSITIEYAAIIYPVFFFSLAIIFFFLFVRRLFINFSNTERNIISLIATAFFVVAPLLVHRTTAGIPEKESSGIFFIFAAFYFFTMMLQEKKVHNSVIYGLLAGISTGLLGIVWGGVTFLYLTCGLTMLILFFLRNTTKQNFYGYLCWILALTFIMTFFTTSKINLTTIFNGVEGLLTSTTSGIAFFALLLLIVDLILAKINLKIKMPRIILTLITTIVLGIILSLLISPGMIAHVWSDVTEKLLHPMGTDRLTLTVAENSQPYFDTWKSTFGNWFFWLFFFSSALLFYEATKEFKKQEKIVLSIAYIIFLSALIFSRISPNHSMNGVSSLSKFVYFGGFLILLACFLVFYFYAYRTKETRKFNLISKEYVYILIIFVIASISARGAIRLFFFLAPIVAIFPAFAAIKLKRYYFESKEEVSKILALIAAIIVILIMLQSFYIFYKSVYSEARATRPGQYQYQWQYAMDWVRKNTPENAVFSHWWDYGYWIQSIGERATVLDGGNGIPYWDHLMGRHVLTGQNEMEALEFLYTHNATHLLIDSTDIGKYPAYSSIGSDENYDRYSWVNIFSQDEKSTQETRNETVYLYRGGMLLDEDLRWYDEQTGKQIILPAQSGNAVIAGFTVPVEKGTEKLKQPSMVVVYQGNRVDIPLKCIYTEHNEKKYEFEKGFDACVFIAPTISQTNSGVNINKIGALYYLSRKAVNTLWVKLYFFNEGENFKLVHSEPNLIVKQLNEQGANLPQIVVFGDTLGPIKIWEINYPAGMEVKQEYLQKNYPNEALWIARGF